VWEWKQNSGGAFANINRPVSGATHERVLPCWFAFFVDVQKV
jgi:hypothetical protein